MTPDIIDYDKMGLKKIGEGEYCKVYILNDGNVLKVPKFRGSVDEADVLIERHKIANEIVESTNVLLKHFPLIIVPVYLGAGGTIIQKYINGSSYSNCSSSIRREINKIIDDAMQLKFPDAPFPDIFVDSNEANFKVCKKTNEIFWFDPVCPGYYS